MVRVSGMDAYPIVNRVFSPIHKEKSVLTAKGYTALFGHYLLDGQEMDETVALFYRAPHSYTGEDVIELSVHGGNAMAEGLLQALYGAGAIPASGGEFTRRALENGRLDLTQAEAVMDIISANGRQGAALASTALKGRLSQEIAQIAEALMELRGHLAAWVDYPEENVPELEESTLRTTLEQQLSILNRLIQGYEAGAVLRRGVDAVIVGRPNVGKSTLMNLLAGFDRAIVTPIAGTTRDVVEQSILLGDSGIRLNLFDTAGLHQTEDVVEAEGIRRSYQKLEEAGLIIAVFDQSQPMSREDFELALQCKNRPALAIFNKDDLPSLLDTETLAGGFKLALPISMKDEQALSLLTDAIRQVLGVSSIDPYAPSLSNQRQRNAALRARDALQEGLTALDLGLDAVSVCLDDALDALYDLTGRNAGEDVIEEVFSKFCVGK